MKITQIREAVAECLEPLGTVQVWIAPTEYGQTFGPNDDLRLSAKIIVGPADQPGMEEQIDDLFDDVPQAIHDAMSTGALAGVLDDAFVSSCTGHRLYASGVEVPPVLGAEWTIKAVAKEAM